MFWALGEATYSIHALFLGVAIPYLSLADVFWLTGYPFVLVGMAVFLLGFRFAIRKKALAFAFLVSVVSSGLIAVFLVFPIVSISTDLMADLVGLAYPILDVALLFTSIVGVLLFRGGKVARGWYWLVLGAILISIGDIMFSHATAMGVYFDGHPLELFFDYAYLCFGLSVYNQLRSVSEM